MSADLIRKMQENVAKYGKTNVATLLMMQAIKEIQGTNAERDQLKAANAELADALTEISSMQGTENDESDAVERLIPEMCDVALAALAKYHGATA